MPSIESSRINERPCCPNLIAWTSILLFLAIGWIGHQRNQPLPAMDIGADPFSALQAHQWMVETLGDELPHPAGTPQNDVVRERIVNLVSSWGYSPKTQMTQREGVDWKRSGDGWVRSEVSVPLENIYFERKGSRPGKGILILTHYDSAPTSPGICDDGVGMVAALEIARLVSNGPTPERNVMFLITDGEESGLLGAQAWCEQESNLDDVGLIINMEARGTSGPSLMFQTGPQSDWLVKQFANASRRPRTSSLFFEIYRFLPNDTDFTVFDEHGISGYNFAFVGDVAHYHTPFDDLENMSLDSLQHHGDNAWRLLNQLQGVDFESIPEGRAVYFDVLAFKVVQWPTSWSLPMACMAFLVLSISLVLSFGIHRKWTATLLGSLKLLVLYISTAASVYALVFLFRFDSAWSERWLDQPEPAQIATWLAGIGMLIGGISLLRIRWDVSLIVLSLMWGILAILSSVFVVGTSFLFLIPMIGTLPGVFLVYRNATVSVVLPIAISAIIWLPTEKLIYDAMGFVPALHGIRIAISLLALTPAIALMAPRHRIGLGLLTGAGLVAARIFA